jgi:Na+-transporting methylmalonyl-CoA/oxaloacetate decarboxylase beta subunit
MKHASSTGIIGMADGPTAIFVASKGFPVVLIAAAVIAVVLLVVLIIILRGRKK